MSSHICVRAKLLRKTSCNFFPQYLLTSFFLNGFGEYFDGYKRNRYGARRIPSHVPGSRIWPFNLGPMHLEAIFLLRAFLLFAWFLLCVFHSILNPSSWAGLVQIRLQSCVPLCFRHFLATQNTYLSKFII